MAPAGAAPGSREQDARAALSLPWLTRLRWGGVAAQLMTVAVGHWTLGLDVPLVPVLAMIGVSVLTNVALGPLARAAAARPTRLCAAACSRSTR